MLAGFSRGRLDDALMRGMDVILDIIGGDYLPRNIAFSEWAALSISATRPTRLTRRMR